MKQKRHALYILAPEESVPSRRLQECATITALAAKDLPSALSPAAKADLVALRLPMHPVVREKINSLHSDPELGKLPILGIGGSEDGGVDAHITEDIHHDDLSTALELLCELHRCEVLIQEEKTELAHSHKELHQIADELVEVISMLLDLRVPDASRRGRRVAEIAEYLGRQVGLSGKPLQELTWAAKLRELGKSGLSDELLAKPRQMRTESDKDLYNRYPVWGGIVLGGMPGLRAAATMIYHQLENFDGTGFPNGLQGTGIPVGSRILRVAAAFEMVAGDSEGSQEQALQVLERGTNREFDPLLVRFMASYLEFASSPDWDSNVMRVPLAELQEGQTLAEDLWTRSGVKLLPRGTKLTHHKIELILNYRSKDPTVDTITVYRPGKG